MRTLCTALLAGLLPTLAHANVLDGDSNWSVSFGLGASLLGRPSAPALGPQSIAASTDARGLPPTTLSLLAERRLTGPLWLLARAEAGHSSRGGGLDSPPPEILSFSGVTTSASSEESFAGGSLGLRYVFNPGGRVELSTFGLGGAGYGRNGATTRMLLPPELGRQGAPVTLVRELFDRTLFFGGSGGLAFETAFNSQLSLRLSSTVVSALWSRTTREEQQSDGDGVPVALPQKASLRS
ncbi:MAG: hypothetical protein ACK4N5_19255, partial [Myxococcales bacterium]